MGKLFFIFAAYFIILFLLTWFYIVVRVIIKAKKTLLRNLLDLNLMKVSYVIQKLKEGKNTHESDSESLPPLLNKYFMVIWYYFITGLLFFLTSTIYLLVVRYFRN